MKKRQWGFFSLSENEGDYFAGENRKIELMACPNGGNSCSEHLAVINSNFGIVDESLANKDYTKSIEALNVAFQKANELQEESCMKCAELFKQSIIQSLEEIQNDLKIMSRGLFGKRRFQANYIQASELLKEFKDKKA